MKRVNTNPHILKFALKQNAKVPNSKLPVLVYREVFILPKQKNKSAEIIQKTFLKNGWSNSWRNGIYDFHHYHSTTHECMGIAMGTADIILGGPGGRKVRLAQGDIIILPAGTGHKCKKCSENFLCVGAYPQGKDYDTCLGKSSELEKSLSNIKKLALPMKDPVLGKEGFLKTYWKK